jgi:hypothetical protein
MIEIARIPKGKIESLPTSLAGPAIRSAQAKRGHIQPIFLSYILLSFARQVAACAPKGRDKVQRIAK